MIMTKEKEDYWNVLLLGVLRRENGKNKDKNGEEKVR